MSFGLNEIVFIPKCDTSYLPKVGFGCIIISETQQKFIDSANKPVKGITNVLFF